MPITQQDLDAAIAEFVESAFRRFFFFDENKKPEIFHCNSEIEPSGFDFIELRPLPELLEHDIEVYGDNAHFMWFYDCDSNCPCDNKSKCVFKSNNDIFKAIDTWEYRLRRKTTGSFPFNLERAKAGDAVQYLVRGLLFDIKDFVPSDRADYAHTGVIDGVSTSFFYDGHLRHPYPPRL